MINPASFFNVSYGLYIITSGNKKSRNGFIANSVFQVTATPPQFAVCCNKENYTAGIIKETGVFIISALDKNVSSKFIGNFGYKTGSKLDKLKDVEHFTGKSGAPVITENIISYIECKVNQTVDAGTHLIFIGNVIQADILNNKKPLTYDYYRDVKKGIAPKNAPTFIDKKTLDAIKQQKADKTPLPRFKCPVCGYIYEPEKGDASSGIIPGTAFENLPDDWKCPVCETPKNDFFKLK
jgi:flavin reductase (DIM6/NTAB) family NADH-FMN oxidoreductase RutF/rubredoxin